MDVRGFRITANQVTFARLIAIPFLIAGLYGGTASRLVALVLGILVGFTDFVDGWLARKYGPTVLGGLMDPIADKVFVVAALLAYADLGLAPWWLVHAVLLREFVVTALRSSFEARHRTLRSTYLAKVKTWVQMFGLAAVLAVALLPRPTLLAFYIAVPALALGAGLVALAAGRAWRGIWIFTGAFGAASAVFVAFGGPAFATGTFIAMAAITWVSAFDYLAGAVRLLRPVRGFDRARLAGAVALPVLAALCHALPWAVIALVIIEVAHGGLDNLLAHEDAAAPTWAWSVRTLGASVLLGAALLAPRAAEVLILAALAVSLSGTAAEFWRQRRYYLDPKAVKAGVRASALVP